MRKLFNIFNNIHISDYLLSNICNPTPKSKLLPYTYYDMSQQLYFSSEETVGFVLEANPLVGCDEHVHKQLLMLLNDILPFGSCLQTLLLASDDLSEPFMQWQDSRVKNDEIYQKLEQYRFDFFNQYNAREDIQYKYRNYRLFFSFSMNNADLNVIKAFRDKLVSILSAIKMKTWNTVPLNFIRLIQEVAFYNKDFVEYYEHQLIADHFPDVTNALLVDANNIFLQNGKYVTRCYYPNAFPKTFSLNSFPALLGDAYYDNMQIPTRFIISYTIINDIHNTQQEALKTKGEMLLKQSNSILAKFNYTLKDEVAEWQEIIAKNLKQKEKFITTGLSVILTSKAEIINKVEQNLISLWKKNDIDLKQAKYFHLPTLLSTCPFIPMIGLKDLMKQFKISRVTLSSEVNAFLPINNEWKGSKNGGMLLSGRRGQVFTWNSFERGSNYNVCITGESGSGKSVFLQEFVVNHLSRGTKVFVVDIGRSFEKTCKLLGGDFIFFGFNSKISLNLFSNIPCDVEIDDATQLYTDKPNLAQDSLSMLKLIIAKMVAPKSGTIDIEDAMIAKAITETWMQYKNKANIDRLIEVLNSKGKREKDLALMLFEFSSEGSYGKFFNTDSNINFKNNFTVLEFEELRERPDLGAVIMQMLAIEIMQQVYLGDRKQKFIILFDEAWYALNHFPHLLASMARTMRKYHGGLVIATQSLNDFYSTSNKVLSESDKARIGVIENSSWRVLLKQKLNFRNKPQDIGLSEEHCALIKTLNTVDGHYSEALICQSDQEYFVARLMLDNFSQILYSSRPDLFSKVKELIEGGLSLSAAIENIMKG